MGDEKKKKKKSTQYVQLEEQDATLHDIFPGELNQPVSVPELASRRCSECGQKLPVNHQPPADEPWSTAICGCTEDVDSCWTGALCPCVLFGMNMEKMGRGHEWRNACVLHAVLAEGGCAAAAAVLPHVFSMDFMTGLVIWEGAACAWSLCSIYAGLYREHLQRKYHLQNSPCDPVGVHMFMHWCAICQEHREMKMRLSDDVAVAVAAAVTNPPAMQEMTMNAGPPSTRP